MDLLAQHCKTSKDLDYLTAWRDNGESFAAAARSLGLNESTVRSAIKRIKVSAAEKLSLIHI